MNTRDKFFPMGRMISGSKRCPKGHACVFNANICAKSKGKIWFGDLDITTDGKELRQLAADTGEDIFVLRESDARFLYEDNPRYERAVVKVTPAGEIEYLVEKERLE